MSVFFKAIYFSSITIAGLFAIVNTQSLLEHQETAGKVIEMTASIIASLCFISSILFVSRTKYIIIIFSVSAMLAVEIFSIVSFLLDLYCLSDACISYEKFGFPLALLSDFALIAFLSINIFASMRALKSSQ